MIEKHEQIANEFKQADHLLKEGLYQEAIGAMRGWGKAVLAQFLQTYAHRYDILKLKPFNAFWAERRNDLKIPSNLEFTFTSQPKHPDIDFVLGYAFYLLAINAQAKQDETKYTQYLKQGLKFNSIHAAQESLHCLLNQKTDEKQEAQEIIERFESTYKVLEGWKGLAELHGTAGYLLLANGYLHLVKQTLDQETKEHLGDRYDSAIFFLWKNLALAQTAESASAAAINNAYFGEGLKLSNPLLLSTIEEMKEQSARRLTTGNVESRAASSAAAEVVDDDSNAKLVAWLKAKHRRTMAVTPPPEEPKPSSPRGP